MFLYFLFRLEPFLRRQGVQGLYILPFPLSHEISETSRISGHNLDVLGTYPEFWTNPEILDPVGTLVIENVKA